VFDTVVTDISLFLSGQRPLHLVNPKRCGSLHEDPPVHGGFCESEDHHMANDPAYCTGRIEAGPIALCRMRTGPPLRLNGLEKCRVSGNDKPVLQPMRVHCYKPEMRASIRTSCDSPVRECLSGTP